jgi:hypothetical protein
MLRLSGRMTVLNNERLAYIQQNSEEGRYSRDGGVREGSNGTTRARRPPATANDRSFPPDTIDRIFSCLEEEFPRYATATENFPCADRSPCGICRTQTLSLFTPTKGC